MQRFALLWLLVSELDFDAVPALAAELFRDGEGEDLVTDDHISIFFFSGWEFDFLNLLPRDLRALELLWASRHGDFQKDTLKVELSLVHVVQSDIHSLPLLRDLLDSSPSVKALSADYLKHLLLEH